MHHFLQLFFIKLVLTVGSFNLQFHRRAIQRNVPIRKKLGLLTEKLNEMIELNTFSM